MIHFIVGALSAVIFLSACAILPLTEASSVPRLAALALLLLPPIAVALAWKLQ